MRNMQAFKIKSIAHAAMTGSAQEISVTAGRPFYLQMKGTNTAQLGTALAMTTSMVLNAKELFGPMISASGKIYATGTAEDVMAIIYLEDSIVE